MQQRLVGGAGPRVGRRGGFAPVLAQQHSQAVDDDDALLRLPVVKTQALGGIDAHLALQHDGLLAEGKPAVLLERGIHGGALIEAGEHIAPRRIDRFEDEPVLGRDERRFLGGARGRRGRQQTRQQEQNRRDHGGQLRHLPALAQHGGKPAQEQFGDQAGVHPREPEVVAAVVKMGDAAFAGPEITHRGRQVHRRHAGPEEAHGRLGVEIVAASAAPRGHDVKQGSRRVDAEAKERIIDGRPQRFETHQAGAELAAVQALRRHVGPEDGAPEDHRPGLVLRGRHEAGDAGGRMLAVGIHDQRVSEALRHCIAQTGQHGRAFAAVAWQHEYAQAGLMLRHRHHRQVAAVGAAIDDQKHRTPVAQHLGHDPG